MKLLNDRILEKLNQEEKIIFLTQKIADRVPGSYWVAKRLSDFGEHAWGWLFIAVIGRYFNTRNSKSWIKIGLATLIAHLSSILIKIIVKRPRPKHDLIKVGIKTPSNYSFPSAHAASTAAALALASQPLKKSKTSLLTMVLAPMMLSRLVLGVHYLSDVLGGSALGLLVSKIFEKIK